MRVACVRSQIEECQQRDDQEPHQERRARATVVIGAPEDGKDQVLHREQRKYRVMLWKEADEQRK